MFDYHEGAHDWLMSPLCISQLWLVNAISTVWCHCNLPIDISTFFAWNYFDYIQEAKTTPFNLRTDSFMMVSVSFKLCVYYKMRSPWWCAGVVSQQLCCYNTFTCFNCVVSRKFHASHSIYSRCESDNTFTCTLHTEYWILETAIIKGWAPHL